MRQVAMKSGFSRRCGALAVAACLGAFLALPATALGGPQSELTRIKAEITRELRARPEMQQARQDWLNVRDEYRLLRQRVVHTLTRDSAYLATRAELWKTEDELAALANHYRNGVIPQQRLETLAKRILELRGILGRMEADVIARQQDVIAAKQAYLDAARRLGELNREIKDLVRADPRFQQALANVRGGRGPGGIRP